MGSWVNGYYRISTEPGYVQLDKVEEFLRASYWAKERPRRTIESSLANSMVFSIFLEDKQIGIARVVTDYSTFAWLCDVFIEEEHRGLGLSKWLMEIILSHPHLDNISRWLLATKDAQELYSRYGFKEITDSYRWMERLSK